MAARSALGTSTRGTLRAGAERRCLSTNRSSATLRKRLRILLWQQARIGISQGTSGAELPPALLSWHDRHVRKSGFRSILRLIEFIGSSPCFATP
jgi:hypothetical protein